MTKSNLILFYSFLVLVSSALGAMLPHQGRVLISGTPFDGNATFRFALVEQSGGIVWNHEGGTGLPGTDLTIEVKKGFYQCHLGDTSITGMATLPEGLFSTYPGLKLRIWFNDGTNGIQQLGKDQPLLVAPYAMNVPLSSASANLIEGLAQGISQYATTSGVSSTQLVTQLTELAGKVATGAIDINSLSPQKIQELVRQTVQPSVNNNLSVKERISNFTLSAIQAGSTLEIDDLKILDLDTNSSFYSNDFSTPIESHGDLLKYDYVNDFRLITNETPLFDPSFIKINNGKLVLKAGSGIFQHNPDFNGRARINVKSIPNNYLVEFKLRKLQSTGHFDLIFYDTNKTRILSWGIDGRTIETIHIASDVNATVEKIGVPRTIKAEATYRVESINDDISLYVDNVLFSKIKIHFKETALPIQPPGGPSSGNPAHASEVIGTMRSYIFVDEQNETSQLTLPSAVQNKGKQYSIYSKLPNLQITAGAKEMESKDYALLKFGNEIGSISSSSAATFVSDGAHWRHISAYNNRQHGGILIFGDFPKPPKDLNSTTALVFSENISVGSVIGEFNATDPDAGVLTYQLVSGQGDGNNSLFLLDANGTLKTNATFDYETNASTYSIRVQAKDDQNTTVQGVFTVTLTDDVSDNIEASYSVSGGQQSAPYYTFTDGNGQTPDFSTHALASGKIYEFNNSGVSGSHPFMIGESYGDMNSTLVTGGPLSGSGGKITVTIPSDYNGSLYYFCTNHAGMSQQFSILGATHIVDLNSSVSLEMIWVEPGTFMMGQVGVAEPVHEVTLTEGFYLGKFEVTQAQYEAVMTGNADGLNATPSSFDGYPNYPVEQVSYDDVQVFLSRLNNLESANIPAGWAYVLPTEAQWEYACRAGTTTDYSWGDDFNASQANGNYPFTNRPLNVGQYAPNPWGFFDFHGNVLELPADWYETYPTGNPVVDPTGPASGSTRVRRGGSWGSTATVLRSARRNGSIPPSYRSSSLGFRVGFQKQ
jgi:formylglycine-generating enzyme required for sulfatase activity